MFVFSPLFLGLLLDQFLVFFELHILAFAWVGALYGWSHVHDDTLSIDHLVHLHISVVVCVAEAVAFHYPHSLGHLHPSSRLPPFLYPPPRFILCLTIFFGGSRLLQRTIRIWSFDKFYDLDMNMIGMHSYNQLYCSSCC